VIDVLVSSRRDTAAARTFFAGALRCEGSPAEVTTDRAQVYPRVITAGAARQSSCGSELLSKIVNNDSGVILI
jgi:transposase-like protein